MHNLLNKPRWHTKLAVLTEVLSNERRDLLFDDGSLTRRLVKLTKGHFKVQKLSQTTRCATLVQARQLNIREKQQLQIREVLLQGHGKNLVYAITLIPQTSLEGSWRYLNYLGSRSLGAYLFKQNNLKRLPIEIAYIKPHHLLFQHVKPYVNQSTAGLWARRSLFNQNKKSLMVMEFFLDDLFNYAQ